MPRTQHLPNNHRTHIGTTEHSWLVCFGLISYIKNLFLALNPATPAAECDRIQFQQRAEKSVPAPKCEAPHAHPSRRQKAKPGVEHRLKPCVDHRVLPHLAEVLMDKLNTNRTLAYTRSNSLYRVMAHIAHGKDAGDIRFQQIGVAFERPSLRAASIAL